MRIEVLAMSSKQTSATSKSLKAVNQHTKEMLRDLSDARIDVTDVEAYIKLLNTVVDNLSAMLYEDSQLFSQDEEIREDP